MNGCMDGCVDGWGQHLKGAQAHIVSPIVGVNDTKIHRN